MNVLCVVLMAAFAATVALAGNPGLRFRLTDKFLEGLKDVAKAYAARDHTEVPSVLPFADLPNGLEMKGYKIADYDLSNADISFASPNQIRLTSKAGSVMVKAFMTRNGNENVTATATVGGIDIDVALAFGRSDDTHLSFAKDKCSVAIGSADVAFEGSDVSEMQTAAQQGMLQVKAMIPAMLCPQLEMILAMGSSKLQMMPTSVPIFRGLAIDLALVNDPLATDEFLQFDISGRTHKFGEMEADVNDYSPAEIDSEVDNSRMFYIWLSEEMANRFLSEYHDNGLSSYTINKDSGKRYVFTKAKKEVKKIAASLGKEIKDDDDVEITIKTAEAPTVTMEEAKPEVGMNLKMEITVKIRPGADDETVVKGVIATKGSVSMKWNETVSGEAYPKFVEKYVLSELSIESLEGIEVTESQKTDLAESIKTKVQRYIVKKLQQMHSKDTTRQRRMEAKYGKIENFVLKVNDDNLLFALTSY